MSPQTNSSRIQHLYYRAGFGVTPSEMNRALSLDHSTMVERFIANSSAEKPIRVIPNDLDLSMKRLLKGAERKKLLKQNKQYSQDLVIKWFYQLGDSEAMFREKMTFFWHGHFACRVGNSIFQEKFLNLLRRHALGDFRTLVLEVARSGAMISFLNNRQNRKDHPNENFARELLELFTIGRGNYTENDIKEAARAFTGWSNDIRTGEFRFVKKHHDHSRKTFMGKTGWWDGHEIIDIILEDKRCAKFIVTQIYQFFINPRVDEEKVASLASEFYDSGYQILPLMKKIFRSDWFYADENVGALIKSPIDLLANLNRNFPIAFKKDNQLIGYQRFLGQLLMNPPSVAGWAGDRSWIDTSTLIFRLRLASLLINGGVIGFETDDPKERAQMVIAEKARKKVERMGVSADWDHFIDQMDGLSDSEIVVKAAQVFIPKALKGAQKDLVEAQMVNGAKGSILRMLSLPEFQTC